MEHLDHGELLLSRERKSTCYIGNGPALFLNPYQVGAEFLHAIQRTTDAN